MLRVVCCWLFVVCRFLCDVLLLFAVCRKLIVVCCLWLVDSGALCVVRRCLLTCLRVVCFLLSYVIC